MIAPRIAAVLRREFHQLPVTVPGAAATLGIAYGVRDFVGEITPTLPVAYAAGILIACAPIVAWDILGGRRRDRRPRHDVARAVTAILITYGLIAACLTGALVAWWTLPAITPFNDTHTTLIQAGLDTVFVAGQAICLWILTRTRGDA
jgi:hypothetical protein